MAEEYSYEYYVAYSDSEKREVEEEAPKKSEPENSDADELSAKSEPEEPSKHSDADDDNDKPSEDKNSKDDSKSQIEEEDDETESTQTSEYSSQKQTKVTFGAPAKASPTKSKEAEDIQPPTSEVQTRRRAQTFFSNKKLTPANPDAIILYPQDELPNLSKICQAIVRSSAGDPEKEFHLGKYLLKGENGFPKRSSIGMLYLKNASDQQFKEASMYYAKVLSEGHYCEKDVAQAKKVLKKYRKGKENLDARYLYGTILRRDQQFIEALRIFKRAAKDGCYKSMIEWGKMLYLKQGTATRHKMKAKRLFNQAFKNGHLEGVEWLSNHNKRYAKKRAKEAAKNRNSLSGTKH